MTNIMLKFKFVNKKLYFDIYQIKLHLNKIVIKYVSKFNEHYTIKINELKIDFIKKITDFFTIILFVIFTLTILFVSFLFINFIFVTFTIFEKNIF